MKNIIVSSLILVLQIGIAQAQKPNFVVVIADDHGVYHSTPYGALKIKTPNMQKLANEGILFSNAYVVSPACAPSRAALFTGLMPYRNGIVGNHEKDMQPNVKSLLPLLTAQGYEIVFQGKVAHRTLEFYKGYVPNDIIILDKGDRSDTKMTVVENYLKNRKDSRPLALFVGCNDTHTPFPTTEESHVNPKDVVINKRIYTNLEAQVEMSRYVSAVEYVDAKLGSIRAMATKYLDEENTMTMYTSDHGMAWPFAKWSLYETGIRTPLLVSWPGKIKPNSKTDAMVSWIDLIPTIIDVAGGSTSDDIDGKPFTNVLIGKSSEHRQEIFATHKGDTDFNVYPIRSVRVGDFKYILNLHPEFYYSTYTDIRGGNPKHAGMHWYSYMEASKTKPEVRAFLIDYHSNPAEELYNIVSDPLEMNNLAGLEEFNPKLEELRTMVRTRMKAVNDDESLSGKPRLLKDYPITKGIN